MTQHATLPIITLTIGIVGQWVVIMRSSLADTLREDFVTTARAIGLPRHRVLHHATRNAILPVVALTAINLGFIVAGAIVVETLFSWPGMGLLTYNAILNQDYPLLQGVFLVTSAAVIFANLVADLAYIYLDPRVRTAVSDGDRHRPRPNRSRSTEKSLARRGRGPASVSGLRADPHEPQRHVRPLHPGRSSSLMAIFGPWLALQDPEPPSSFYSARHPAAAVAASRCTRWAPTRTAATSSRSCCSAPASRSSSASPPRSSRR